MAIGKTMLGRRHVLPSVVATLVELQVEGTFPMGTYLVTVHHPISTDDGDLEKALYGSFLPVPAKELFPLAGREAYAPEKMPGAVVVAKTRIALNQGRKRIKLKVTSEGDRPIQVCRSINRRRNYLSNDMRTDWLALPLYRDEPTAQIRPYKGIRLPS
jgi:urease